MSDAKQNASFETASVILFVLMMAANVLNYVYQVAMANALSVEDFGALNAIQAFITIAGIPAGAFLMIASRVTAQTDKQELGRELSPIISASALFGFALTAICLVLSGPISRWLQVDNVASVAIATFFVGINCVFNAISGILQGKKELGHYGMASVVSMLAKLVLSVAFVLCGFQLVGAMSGLILAPLCATTYCLIIIIKRVPFRFTFSSVSNIGKLLQPLKSLLILQVILAVFTNGDIILIKAFFSPDIAGAYSSGMVLGKIPLFAASALVGALFPFVAATAADKKSTNRLLRKALLYGFAIAFACSAVLCLFGSTLIGFFFGERYVASVSYLPAISILAISLTLITILANHNAACDNMAFFNVSGMVGIAICIALVATWHPDTITVIIAMACCIALTAIANLAHVTIRTRRKHN